MVQRASNRETAERKSASESDRLRGSRQRARMEACKCSLGYSRTSGSGRCERRAPGGLLGAGVDALEFAPVVALAWKGVSFANGRMSAEWCARSDVLDVVVTRTEGRSKRALTYMQLLTKHLELLTTGRKDGCCALLVAKWCRSYHRAMLNLRLGPSFAVFAMMMRRPFPCCHAAARCCPG